MTKPVIAFLVAGILAATAAPARTAEMVSADDMAHFLAGLPVSPQSSLAPLTASASWQQYAHRFDSLFGREDRDTLSKVRAFSEAQLTNPHDSMLYMFSGPDFLYATSFFPKASTYVLSGLEPVGNIPQLALLKRGSIEAVERNMEISLNSILSFSFFITKKMKSELAAGPVYGTVPILYVFLARTGKTIHEVSLVALDEQGNIETAGAPAAAAAPAADQTSIVGESGNRPAAHAPRNTARGVKIVFSDDDRPNQTLYYFSTNLDDQGVKSSGLLAFCDKLGPADSLIKSASYLMHRGGFAKVRNFLLDRSATILQDDTGIPVAYFDARKWRLRAFGRYIGPLPMFGVPAQPRMAQLFRNAAPLDFGIGYRWHRNESNLLLAEKISPGTEPVLAGEKPVAPPSVAAAPPPAAVIPSPVARAIPAELPAILAESPAIVGPIHHRLKVTKKKHPQTVQKHSPKKQSAQKGYYGPRGLFSF